MFLHPDRYFASKKDWFILSVFAAAILLLKVLLIGLIVLIGKFVDLSEEIIPLFNNVNVYDERRMFYAWVVAPILETLVFQYMIIKGLLYINLLKKYPAIPILLSTIIFSSVHSNAYTVMFAGVLLGYNFYYFNKYKSGSFAYWSTVFLHAFYNIITYLLAYKYIEVWL